jgi:hypothetical protein
VRWPHGDVELPSTLYLADIYAQVEAVPGVASSTITTPAADTANTAAENTAPVLLAMGGDGAAPDLLVTWAVAS